MSAENGYFFPPLSFFTSSLFSTARRNTFLKNGNPPYRRFWNVQIAGGEIIPNSMIFTLKCNDANRLASLKKGMQNSISSSGVFIFRSALYHPTAGAKGAIEFPNF